MSDYDIHSCGYYCDRPACIKAQRDELRQKLFSDQAVKTYSGGKPNYTEPEPDYEAEFIKDWNEGKVKRVSDGKRMVPEREWQGLTDDELSKTIDDVIGFNSCVGWEEDFARTIEAKLKEKNNG